MASRICWFALWLCGMPKRLRQARLITIAWYAVVFGGMCFVGLVGHVLHAGLDNPETVFFALTDSLFTAGYRGDFAGSGSVGDHVHGRQPVAGGRLGHCP